MIRWVQKYNKPIGRKLNRKPNRLINEKSPYLLQHAFNPVEWFPWCDEAFEKAKREDKPIFLSIGYSTCHWCHVMEKESFEDEATAKLVNDVFVSIKVDREERPDIDNIYMMVCQMMTGAGGWPLSIVMTPEKKPFFAGTYFPNESMYGRIGFKDLIKNIDEAWKTKRKELEENSDQIVVYLQQTQSEEKVSTITVEHLDNAYNNFLKRFDSVHGGFGSPLRRNESEARAPKFPSPHNLMFLLRYWKRTGNQNALNMVTKTLTEMRMGGIYDHVGFGFHRYSTDAQWLVPHFEKMLYDQALLIMAYTEAFQITKNKEFKRTAEEIITYVLHDMISPERGFYSAEDADSEGVEGKFYVWKKDELAEVLENYDVEFASLVFNVSPSCNFHEESSDGQHNVNILHRTKTYAELSKELGLSEQQVQLREEDIRNKLFSVRKKRIHPHKDDKLLTDWNGLMIAALSFSGRALDNKAYIKQAAEAFEFIEKKLMDPSGMLWHRYRDGEAALTGTLDDYAFMVWASIELYEATFERKYIQRAVQLADYVMKCFHDEVNGGFYFTSTQAEKLIVRTKEFYDGAIPSGNSVMLYNLLRLNRFTADSKYEVAANKFVDHFSNAIIRATSGSSFALCALDFLFGPSYEIVLACPSNDEQTNTAIEKLNEIYLPNKIVILQNESDIEQKLRYEYLSNYKPIENKPTYYVCKNFMCNLPTNDFADVLAQLGIASK